LDIDPSSPADIHADLRFPEKIPEIRNKKWDIIYCDPPYMPTAEIIERPNTKGKNAPVFGRGYDTLYSILSSLSKYAKYQPSGGLLLLKIQDQQKDGVYIPHHITAYHLIRTYIPRQPIIYGYKIHNLFKYGYLMPFIRP